MRRNMKTLLKLMCFVILTGCFLYCVKSASSAEQCSKRDESGDCTEAVDFESVSRRYTEPSVTVEKEIRQNMLHLSVVACGDRLNESMVLLKSATLLTRAPIHAHIFADDELRPQFKERLDEWPDEVLKKFLYSLYPIQYPADQDAHQWKKLFKVCSSQRLFLPDILKDVDSLLYVDTDILFLRPLDDIWKFFTRFNSSQIAAMAPESEEPTAAWYSRFARHPYFPPHGVNSGVMLMNLTRMREVGWLTYIIPYYKRYKLDITWGDQDLINIFFHYFPDKLYLFPCNWNYRPDHCMYMSNCKAAEQKGISILHGSRSSFQNEKQPAFKAVYKALEKHKFGKSLEDFLLPRVQRFLRNSEHSQCKKVSHIFTKQFEREVRRHSKLLAADKQLAADSKSPETV